MREGFDIIPINCIWMPPDDLVSKIKLIFKDSSDWAYTKASLNLKTIFSSAPPKGGAHLPQFVVWQPDNVRSGSVLVSNYEDGMIQLMRHLNMRFQVQFFSAFLAENYKKAGLCTFTFAQSSGHQMVVQVIRDPQWKFYDQGEIQSFESVAFYASPQIPERLSPKIITEYLKALGWNLEADAFWRSSQEAWYVSKTTFRPKG